MRKFESRGNQIIIGFILLYEVNLDPRASCLSDMKPWDRGWYVIHTKF